MKGLFLSLTLLITLISCSLADLRTGVLQEESVSSEYQKQARDILTEPLDPLLHPDLWKNAKAMEVHMIDYWESSLVRSFTPIPEKVQAMKVRFLLDENTIHIQLLDGKKRDYEFGLEKGKVFQTLPETGKVFREDSSIRIYAESLKLYLILPFQLHNYSNVAYIGDMGLGEREYKEIFATQGDWKPSSDYDQYRVYIRKDNGQIEFIKFTYRDVLDSYIGVLHYEEYTKLQDKLFPMKIAVKEDFGGDGFVHQLQIGKVRFFSSVPKWEEYDR